MNTNENNRVVRDPGEIAEPKKGSKPAAEEGESVRAQVPEGELTPEEQMAKFEEDLKESDWGHQPC
jgi:hypothetical protein